MRTSKAIYKCQCGKVLPRQSEDEIPYEFCTSKCRLDAVFASFRRAIDQHIEYSSERK